MKKGYVLHLQDFDSLLELFSEDREEAGQQYEQLRDGLIRFFEFRGCNEPESLADETFNRVASKMSTFDRSANVKPAAYVYGFARNILLEYRRTGRARESQLGGSHLDIRADGGPDTSRVEADHACLQKCLSEVSDADRSLLLEYFSREGSEKIQLRKRMADRHGWSAQVLQSRIFRLKGTLKGCIERCREEIP